MHIRRYFAFASVVVASAVTYTHQEFVIGKLAQMNWAMHHHMACSPSPPDATTENRESQ